MPVLLQQAGYQTALVGKWHLQSYPRGFDHWLIYPGQGLYVDPRLIKQNGDTVTYRGYSTDIVTAEAINRIDKRDKSKPFALLLHHKAPRRNFLPPLKYVEQFQHKTFPEPAKASRKTSIAHTCIIIIMNLEGTTPLSRT